MMLLELSCLTRQYASKGGVTNVTLNVPTGAIYVLCGANGAGKTTTLAVLAGLLFAERGELRIAGRRVAIDRYGERFGFGYMPDTPYLDEDLTGEQWASFVAAVKQVPLHHRAEAWAEAMQLDKRVLGQNLRELSFGTRRKIALWTELVSTRALLVLDEPLTGLDPAAIHGFRSVAREFCQEGRAIVLSTHLLHEADVMASHVGMIHQGEIRWEGSIESVRVRGSLHDAFLQTVDGLTSTAKEV